MTASVTFTNKSNGYRVSCDSIFYDEHTGEILQCMIDLSIPTYEYSRTHPKEAT